MATIAAMTMTSHTHCSICRGACAGRRLALVIATQLGFHLPHERLGHWAHSEVVLPWRIPRLPLAWPSSLSTPRQPRPPHVRVTQQWDAVDGQPPAHLFVGVLPFHRNGSVSVSRCISLVTHGELGPATPGVTWPQWLRLPDFWRLCSFQDASKQVEYE